jgi:hypothetical protein
MRFQGTVGKSRRRSIRTWRSAQVSFLCSTAKTEPTWLAAVLTLKRSFDSTETPLSREGSGVDRAVKVREE